MTYRIPIFPTNPSKPSSGKDQSTTGTPTKDKPVKDIEPITEKDKKPKIELESMFVDLGGGERARAIRQLYETVMLTDVSNFNLAGLADPRHGMCQPLSHLINQIGTSLDQVYQRQRHQMGLVAAEYAKDWLHENRFGTLPGSSTKNLVLQVRNFYTPRIAMGEIPVLQGVLDEYLLLLDAALKEIDDALSELVQWIRTHWEDKDGNQHSFNT